MLSLFLLIPAAHALTLEQALSRAAEVDPGSIIANLSARKESSQSAEAWANVGLTPSMSLTQPLKPTASASASLSMSVDLLNPPAWFNALAQGSNAAQAWVIADATARDARYAVAAMWFQAFAAEEAEDLAQTSLSEARGTSDAAEARLRAGLASELDAKAARLGVLNAQAALASAQSARFIALARLSSALQVDVPKVEATAAPVSPDTTGESPWIEAYVMNVQQARWAEASSIAALFPTARLSASTPLLPGMVTNSWTVALTASWSFSGVLSPILNVQQAHLDRKVTEVQLEQQRRTDSLYLEIAHAQVDAAKARRSAAVDGERLAGETVAVGRARLGAGLISTLDMLKLQEQEAQARVQRVSAELDLALAVLDTRRLSGLAVIATN